MGSVNDAQSGDVSRLFERLDADQRAVVTADDRLCCVIAGAGSGKTTALTTRIAYRVATEVIDHDHTLAITFTRQAAGELRRRLRGMLGQRATVAATTFHALALGLLREHWALRRQPARNLLRSRLALVTELVGNRSVNAHVVTGEIDWAAARGIDAASYESEAAAAGRRPGVALGVVADAYQQYGRQKYRRGVIDYDDLLVDCARALVDDAEFGAAIRWRHRHLFVDEFQDINALQFRLLEAVRGHRPDLTVVGDPNQAIYSWNGAVPDLLNEIDRTYPGVRVMRLERNYRCAESVMDAATAVLRTRDIQPTARAVRPGGSVAWREVDDDKAEATAVVDIVRRALGPGRRPSRVAVLARTNAQLAPVHAALNAAGIPAVLSGATGDRPSFRLGAAVRDEVLALHGRDELAQWAAERRHAASYDRPGDAENDPFATGDVLGPGDDRVTVAVPSRLVDCVADMLAATTAQAAADGAALLAWFDAEEAVAPDAVELLTFHAAKGREWPTVIMIGVESGLVPHWSATMPEQIDEEVRLAYVACTRAADELNLVWATTRDGRATGRSNVLDAVASGPISPPSDQAPWRPRYVTRRTLSPIDARGAALQRWREAMARGASIDPRAVLDDELLDAIAFAAPTNIDELAAINGVRAAMLDRHGARILAVLQATPAD